jgi:hypothetical protein
VLGISTCSEQLLSQFPLEQIQKLSLQNITDDFFTLSSRLTDLKYLSLSRRDFIAMAFPGELFPSLIELYANDFRSIQLTGMTRLQNLETINTPSNQILGKKNSFTTKILFVLLVR